jgi:hypothetical protein
MLSALLEAYEVFSKEENVPCIARTDEYVTALRMLKSIAEKATEDFFRGLKKYSMDETVETVEN